MIRINALRNGLALAAAWLVAIGALQAQSVPLARPTEAPQAKSQAELDSYLEILSAADPREVIQQVDAFARQFAQSELLSSAYQAQLHACEQLDEFDGMLLAGRRSLAGSPDNLSTLLSLSSDIANRASKRPDRDQLLSEAKGYAERALDRLNRVRLPHKISLEQWRLQSQQMQAEAHGVLGLVALQKSQLEEALSQLGTALALAPKPEGVQFFRLALAQVSAGKKQDAEGNLQRAIELGPDPVRTLASSELKRLAR